MEELRVRLLGGLVVDGLRPADVGSRKARRLLALLAVQQGAAVSVDRIVDAVWSDEPPSRPHDQVGVLVSRLRGALGSARLPRRDAGYSLLADWVDVDELERRCDAAVARLRAGDGLSARLAASMALDLDRGVLLPEEDGAWLEAPRAAVARWLATVRSVAAQAALLVGDPLGAVAAASAALEHDPYDEAALRNLMRGHVTLGRPASALAAYATVRARLSEELGASPDVATEALHGAVLRGDPLPPEDEARPPGSAEDRMAAAQPAMDRWDPLLQRARRELAVSDLAAARAHAEEAVRRGGGPAALELAGWVAYYQRDFSTALRLAEQVARATPEDERRESSLTLAGRVRHSRGDLAESEAQLLEAVRSGVPGVRAVGQVWLATLRAHQGRCDDAMELASAGAIDAAAMRHPFVIPHAFLARTYALGQRGDVAGALGVIEDWRRALDELADAGARYQPALENYAAWVLRCTGRGEEARAHNREALARSSNFQEPLVQAVLDLAAAALDEGDATEAGRWLEEVRLPADDDGTMVWHQRQRHWLLSARLALLRGDPTRAHELAERLVVDALARGTARHRVQGSAVALLARAAQGEPLDPEEVETTLGGIDRVAGMEAWRVTAELAAATGRHDLWARATARAEALAAASGARGREVRAWVLDELGRLGRP